MHSHESFIPYTPSEFTKISEKQILACKALTENPKWSLGNLESVRSYYELQEETPLDRNLCYMASTLMGVVIHGNLRQETLEGHLQHFDIRKLMLEGPYQNDLLSLDAQQLIYDSLNNADRILDIHLHNFGYDEGNYINPKISAHKNASYMNYFSFVVLRYACGISSVIGSTHEARKRLHLYAAHFPKLLGMILPIHKAILPGDVVDWQGTGVFLNNHTATLTAASFDNYHGDSELFPGTSVHPFDLQWKEKLHAAHTRGIRLVKWMPPQSIPPDSDLIDDFYHTMAELKMTLIAHSGIEHAIPTYENNAQWAEWGNPLKFRKPLQIGVNVILAHCGHNEPLPDLDDPLLSKKPGIELFVRLAREAHQKNQTGEWKGLLYGDLAAVTTHNGPDFIKELLKVTNEEGIRMLYGSDYPYTNMIKPQHDAYELSAAAGILKPSCAPLLKEIRNWNPLLANYVFTKNLAWQHGEEELRFPPSTFTGSFMGAPLLLIDRDQWINYVKKSS